MFEAVLIFSIVYACMYMPLRGKSYTELTPAQKEKVAKVFNSYLRTRKGKQTPNMIVEEYLPILQKQALTYLIVAIIMVPVYILILLLIYPGLFS